MLSPRTGATRFRHAATPLVHDGHVPLWHTTLAHLRADGALVEAPAELFALKSKELRDGGSAQWRQRVGDGRLAGPLTASPAAASSSRPSGRAGRTAAWTAGAR